MGARVEVKLDVEVRLWAEAYVTRKRDALALLDTLAFFDEDLVDVDVVDEAAVVKMECKSVPFKKCLNMISMCWLFVMDDGVHDAVSDGDHGRTHGTSKVKSVVGSGMSAMTEASVGCLSA